jgi:hypothetical protein
MQAHRSESTLGPYSWNGREKLTQLVTLAVVAGMVASRGRSRLASGLPVGPPSESLSA